MATTTTSTNLGVGSGLPLETMLTQLRTVENQALTLVETRYNTENQRLTAYGTLKSAVENFQTVAKELTKDTTFGSLKGTSSDDSISVSAKPSAIAGTYSVKVEQLAKNQTLVSTGQADRTTSIGTGGKITFTIGDKTQTLDFTDKGTSLNDLVKAINANTDLGVNATIVNDGSDSPHRLLLTTNSTGEDAAISSIAIEGNDDLADMLSFHVNHLDISSLTQQQAAQNAKLSINGIDITSQTNTITSAIDGVTLTLTKEDVTSTVTFSRDDSAATKAINAFVTAYNTLQTTLKSLTSYDQDTDTASVLTGDSLARRVQTQMRETLNVFTDGKVGSLSALGITTDPTSGQLKVDADKLAAAIKDNQSDVKELFAGTDGVAARVATKTDAFLRSDGYFATTQTSIEASIKRIKKEYEATELRIETTMATYRAKFVALDSAVVQMSSTSSYLTTQLAMLESLSSSSSSSS